MNTSDKKKAWVKPKVEFVDPLKRTRAGTNPSGFEGGLAYTLS
ncbi:hypothetical protein [Pontixanthobacter aquaemixtae]|nr:hypothetical protein [Pontixanthobacter aquaemixtae]